MAFLVMAVRDEESREVEADSKIAAMIHVTAFIADQFTVKVWDTQLRTPVQLDGLSSNILSASLGKVKPLQA